MKIVKKQPNLICGALSIMALLSHVDSCTWDFPWRSQDSAKSAESPANKNTTPPPTPRRQNQKESQNVNNSAYIKNAIKIMKETDPYIILGISKGATQKDITGAFRRLSFDYSTNYFNDQSNWQGGNSARIADMEKLRSIIYDEFGNTDIKTNASPIWNKILRAYGKIGFENESPFIKDAIRIYTSRSPWDILDIDQNATPATATKSFHALSLIYHDDKLKNNPDFERLKKIMNDNFVAVVNEPNAGDTDIFFKKINNAYQTMRNR